ncbi:hypothetical protein G3578_05265 [Brevibacillus sp. SYP-B805]|uniref:stage VI sporulation protein F n=1 Tax=Brevibacillus sp. SYP-B805 TaxID=1578199 RepID=UPI0013EB5889|nr:stage VI sporulation protein F [Brevibacillus sp. SYP-B805]NGQ94589.1 hypothetical protein [Brevibacillus sp. SYP-B805]
MSKSVSRLFLDKLRAKGNPNVDEGQLRALAGQMKKSDFEDEEKVRQLLRTLAAMSGTTLSEAKEEQILKMFREKQIDIHNMQSLKKLL